MFVWALLTIYFVCIILALVLKMVAHVVRFEAYVVSGYYLVSASWLILLFWYSFRYSLTSLFACCSVDVSI